MKNEWMKQDWKDLSPGRRFLLFYALLFMFFGLIAALLFILDGVNPHLREAMVILIAALFGNLLYDQGTIAFDLRQMDDSKNKFADEKEMDARIKNIERIVEQWDMGR